MNMSIKETANLLNIDYNSVKMSRYRIKKKLNLEPETDLVEFIHNIYPAA
jgi:DNA-binding CsgD family transcriptional regulator